jgi:hypothetical protein
MGRRSTLPTQKKLTNRVLFHKFIFKKNLAGEMYQIYACLPAGRDRAKRSRRIGIVPEV